MIKIKYNDNYQELTQIINGEVFYLLEHGSQILRRRRNKLGLTQLEVSNAAGINLRQYQRLESGERSMSSTSMRIGLSICQALNLDPYRFK